MKKITLILIVTSLIIGAGCDSDFLDTKPLDKFSEETVWSDVNLTRGFIYNTYATIMIDLVIQNPGEYNKGTGSGVDDLSDNMLVQRSIPPWQDGPLPGCGYLNTRKCLHACSDRRKR